MFFVEKRRPKCSYWGPVESTTASLIHMQFTFLLPEVWSFLTSHSSSSLNLVLAVWLAAQTWRLHQARVNGELATDPLFSAVAWTITAVGLAVG